jgi:hypothetical protein
MNFVEPATNDDAKRTQHPFCELSQKKKARKRQVVICETADISDNGLRGRLMSSLQS